MCIRDSIGAEHVGAVTFVMHAAGDPGLVVWELGDVAEQIGCGAADRRQENLQIRSRYQFRKHAGGLFEQLPAQIVLAGGKAFGEARQVPNRIDRNLDHRYAAVLVHDLAVMLQASGCDGRLQFGQIEARAGNGDARTYICLLYTSRCV